MMVLIAFRPQAERSEARTHGVHEWKGGKRRRRRERAKKRQRKKDRKVSGGRQRGSERLSALKRGTWRRGQSVSKDNIRI